MLFTRVFLCALTVLAGDAYAQEPAPDQAVVAPVALAASPEATEPPRPVRHRGLKIALGIVCGALLIGAVVAVGVTNASSSSNQKQYNDWGSLVLVRR